MFQGPCLGGPPSPSILFIRLRPISLD
jgi:hypothetical protein